MLLLNDGLFLPKLSPFSFSIFLHIAVFVLKLSSGSGSLVVGPSSPVVALVGEDVILPCRLEPAADAVSMIVEWGRPELKPRFVHVWHEGQNLLTNQNPSYKERTSVSTEKLKQGDLSLKLSHVKRADRGTYRCLIPKMNRESNVELFVGAVSLPVMTRVNISSEKKVLQCESKGWYPEPKVIWLDGERKLLFDGPTETLIGPDGLYTVSSILTVERTNGDSFTCRIHQKNINKTRETQIQITELYASDECSLDSSGSAARISITLAVVLVCAGAIVFIVFKWKQGKRKLKMPPVNDTEPAVQEQLVNSESDKNPEPKKTTSDEETQKKEDEQRVIAPFVIMLNNKVKELEKQLKDQKAKMETIYAETEKKIESVEKASKNDRGKGFLDLKYITLRNNGELQTRKQETEKLSLTVEGLLLETRKALEELNISTESNQENISVYNSV